MNTHSFEAPRAPRDTAQIIPFPRRARATQTVPTVFGSAWYHDAAIAEERDAELHRAPHWPTTPGRA